MFQWPAASRWAWTTGRRRRTAVIRGSPAASSASEVPQARCTSSIVTIGAPAPSAGANETSRIRIPSPSIRLAARTWMSSAGNRSRSRVSTRRRTSSPTRCEPSATATMTAATVSGSVQRTMVQSVSVSGFTSKASGSPPGGRQGLMSGGAEK